MASQPKRSFRRIPSTREERSPLLHHRPGGTGQGELDNETYLSTSDTVVAPTDKNGVSRRSPLDDAYSVVHKTHDPATTTLDRARASGYGGDVHHYDNRPPIPVPRQRVRGKYNTMRACQSAGLTQAEFMERSRYVHDEERGDPAAYDEELYAPLPAHQPASMREDIYESVQQHERILDNVRLQPWPLAERIQYRRILRSALQDRVGRLDTMAAVNHNGKRAVSYASKKLSGYATSHGFLSNWIKKIEGQFGTGVASFFVFLRSIFFLNIVTAIFTVGFLVVPQVAFGAGNRNFNPGDTLDKVYNSPVFYGFYDNDTTLNGGYNLPMAYLTVNLALFALCFLFITLVMKRRYQDSKRMSEDKVTCPFSVKVFTFWDFTITEKETSVVIRASIGTGFREELRELKEASRRRKVSLGLILLLRGIINVVVIGLLAGSGYVVYIFVKRDQERSSFNSNNFVAFLEQFELSFILAALRLVGPVIFEKLVLLEKFHPRIAFKWTMSRTMVLYLGNLAVLTTTVLLNASRQKGCETGGPSTGTTPAPSTTSSPSKPRDTCCWESMIGEEFLKIVIIDFGAILLAVLVADVIRAVIVRENRTVREKIGRGEFQVAVSVLDAVYGQGLIWIGTFFSPILPAFAVGKTFLLFFYYYYTTMFSHAAPKKIFRASRSGNFLLFVLQVTLFICMIPILYTVSRLPPSANCGPLRSVHTAYEVITVHFSQATRDGITLIGTPVVLLPLFVLWCLSVVYNRLLVSSYREIIKDIRTQLHFEQIKNWSQEEPYEATGLRLDTAGRSNGAAASHSADTSDSLSRTTTRGDSGRGGSASSLQSRTESTTGVNGTHGGGGSARVSVASRPSSSASSASRAARGSRLSSATAVSSILDEPLPEPPV